MSLVSKILSPENAVRLPKCISHLILDMDGTEYTIKTLLDEQKEIVKKYVNAHTHDLERYYEKKDAIILFLTGYTGQLKHAFEEYHNQIADKLAKKLGYIDRLAIQ
jgi:hypothetical protein